MLRLTCQDTLNQGRMALLWMCALQAVAGLGLAGRGAPMN